MPSVSVSWDGQCPGVENQKHLLSYLRRLADLNSTWLRRFRESPLSKAGADSRPDILVSVSPGGMLARDHPSRAFEPLVDCVVYDQHLKGGAKICETIFPDTDNLPRLTRAAGIRCNEEKPPPPLPPEIMKLLENHGEPPPNEEPERLVRSFVATDCRALGLEFQLFDPRSLYDTPLSFVFLQSPSAPFIDGWMVELRVCDRLTAEGRPYAWAAESPSVHLRYMNEMWMDYLMAWIKVFFAPNLRYWRYGNPARGFLIHQRRLGKLCASADRETICRVEFDLILRWFDREAGRWMKWYELTREPIPEPEYEARAGHLISLFCDGKIPDGDYDEFLAEMLDLMCARPSES